MVENKKDSAKKNADHHSLRSRAKGRLKLVAVLTSILLLIEVIGGLAANSLALLSDAAHMFTDLFAILLVLFAILWASRPATDRKTYGYYRVEILASLLNGALLFFIAFNIFWHATKRLIAPEPVQYELMIPIAVAGLLVNLIAAVLLHKDTDHLATRSAFFHVAGDLLSSIGVVTGGIIISLTGWSIVDPLISFVIAILILFSAIRIIREATDILLEATPLHVPLGTVRDRILEIQGVEDVHDLHVWTISSGFYAASAHLSIYPMTSVESDQIVRNVSQKLNEDFSISHTTFQTETLPPPIKIQPL